MAVASSLEKEHRNIVRPIDATSGYLLGWILVLCSSRRRRLGDHLAGTLVVSTDSVPMLSHRRSRPWLRLSILTILCAFFVVFCLGFAYYDRSPLVIQSLTNANAPSPLLTDRGTITDLVLSQPTWADNTVTYAITFHALNHGITSNCQGNITLRWFGFIGGWGKLRVILLAIPQLQVALHLWIISSRRQVFTFRVIY